MRVLVVDDSAVVRARLVRMLEETSGVTAVDQARDVAEANARIGARLPDCVVLDLHLQNGSGMAVLLRLKEERRAPHVIVITNDANDQSRRQCLSNGAGYFFDKSKELDGIARTVGDLASRAGLVRPAK